MKEWNLRCLTSIFLIFLTGCSYQSANDKPTEAEVNTVLSGAQKAVVFVKGGRFLLGDVGNKNGAPYNVLGDNVRPTIEVNVGSYSISKYEVTWGEFMVYLRDQGKGKKYTLENDFHRAVTLPVESNDDPLSPNFHQKPALSPSYYEAEGYCTWLAEKSGLRYALPTETQWEFAARSRGRHVPYATDSGDLALDPYLQRPSYAIDPSIPPSGNVLVHSSLDVERRPVGTYPPNPLGLHDMTGNVAEWTRDWYFPDFYTFAEKNNPAALNQPKEGRPQKTVRDWAGHGDSVGGQATVFARSGNDLDSPYNGFRCVINSPEPIN